MTLTEISIVAAVTAVGGAIATVVGTRILAIKIHLQVIVLFIFAFTIFGMFAWDKYHIRVQHEPQVDVVVHPSPEKSQANESGPQVKGEGTSEMTTNPGPPNASHNEATTSVSRKMYFSSESSIKVDGVDRTPALKTDYHEKVMRDWLDFQEATHLAIKYHPNASDILLIQQKEDYSDIFLFAIKRGNGVYYLFVRKNENIELGSQWHRVAELPARPFTRDDGSQGANIKQILFVRLSEVRDLHLTSEEVRTPSSKGSMKASGDTNRTEIVVTANANGRISIGQGEGIISLVQFCPDALKNGCAENIVVKREGNSFQLNQKAIARHQTAFNFVYETGKWFQIPDESNDTMPDNYVQIEKGKEGAYFVYIGPVPTQKTE